MMAAMIAAALAPLPPDIPPGAVDVAESFFMTIAVIALGIPLIRAIARRFIERPAPTVVQIPADLTARLERIEQAVDAVAIEVERIAEAQRFSAKLMAEQQRQLPHADS